MGSRELANGDREHQSVGESSTSREEDGLNLLLRYDVVVVDEAHERTLNTDFLCGALKKIQRIRKRLAAESLASTGPASDFQGKGKGREREIVRELKIVIMSATLDPSKFQRFFETWVTSALVGWELQGRAEPWNLYSAAETRSSSRVACTMWARNMSRSRWTISLRRRLGRWCRSTMTRKHQGMFWYSCLVSRDAFNIRESTGS